MFLKPKSTHLEPRALLYRLYIDEVAPSTSLALTFSNIGKYQTNKYYYVGSFSYIRKGTINDTVIQPIKGNMTPLQTLNIQYYNDYINLKNGDLVVVNKHLYSVESVEEDHKHQPKDFAIYTAILNSII